MTTDPKTLSCGDLPLPPLGKQGWPWTEETPKLPEVMPDGEAWPRITVVTPSYNQAQYLEETIRSVLLQGYPNLEYMVLDGGSTDGSVEIIRRYSQWLTYWTSAPDGGQTQAIAAGLARATGELFNWINSDDFLMPGALAVVAGSIGTAHCLVGALYRVDDSGAYQLGPPTPHVLSNLLLGDSGFNQAGTWTRTDLTRKCGGLDTRYQYAFDKELLIRYLRSSPDVRYVPDVLAGYHVHAACKSVRHQGKMDGEMHDIVAAAVANKRCGVSKRVLRKRMRSLRWSMSLADLMARPMHPLTRAMAILCVAAGNPLAAVRRSSGLREGLRACFRGSQFRGQPVQKQA